MSGRIVTEPQASTGSVMMVRCQPGAAESHPEWEVVLFKHMVSSLSALDGAGFVSMCSPGELTPSLRKGVLWMLEARSVKHS